MRIYILVLVALLVFSTRGAAQVKPQETSLPKRCNPKRLPNESPQTANSEKLDPSEFYKRPPVIRFQIEPDGSVSDVTLIRSSGSTGIDRYALRSVQHWKYNDRPGCPVIESKMAVLLDWK